MSKGFDCATPLTLAAAHAFARDGFGFVCRYLSAEGSWKALSLREATNITTAGMHIVSVFEREAANPAKGATQGAADGALAIKYARNVGQPEGTVIYFAVDFDTSPAHYNAIEAYLRAADKAIPGYEVGVYGEKDVCEEMMRRGVVKRVWQTYAWSKGLKVSDPHLYQYKNDISVNGIRVDLDESNGNAGGWKIGMAIKPAVSISVADANKIIDQFLKPEYADAKSKGDTAGADEAHRLANALRQAAGIPS